MTPVGPLWGGTSWSSLEMNSKNHPDGKELIYWVWNEAWFKHPESAAKGQQVGSAIQGFFLRGTGWCTWALNCEPGAWPEFCPLGEHQNYPRAQNGLPTWSISHYWGGKSHNLGSRAHTCPNGYGPVMCTTKKNTASALDGDAHCLRPLLPHPHSRCSDLRTHQRKCHIFWGTFLHCSKSLLECSCDRPMIKRCALWPGLAHAAWGHC